MGSDSRRKAMTKREKNKALVEYLTNGGSYRFTKIHFDVNDVPLDDNSTFTIHDTLSDIETNEEQLSFTLIRDVVVEPNNIFDFTITMKVGIQVSDSYVSKVPWQEIDIDAELREQIHELMTEPLSELSLLIAEITKRYDAPLIIPPILSSPTE
jgi:hypothetical protein